MKRFFNKLLSMAIRIFLLLPLNIYSNIVIKSFSLVELSMRFSELQLLSRKVEKSKENGSQLMYDIVVRILQAIFKICLCFL